MNPWPQNEKLSLANSAVSELKKSGCNLSSQSKMQIVAAQVSFLNFLILVGYLAEGNIPRVKSIEILRNAFTVQ